MRIRTFIVGLTASCAGLLALAPAASAHITVDAPGAAQGGYTVLTFRVPTESAAASTTALRVQMPLATPFSSVQVQPNPGWSFTTKQTKLATPLTTDDGDEISQAVSEIDWTADSAADAIKPGEFEQFLVSVGPLPKVESITFKAIQIYSDGSEVDWTEVPAPGSTAEPEHPAPTLALAAGTAGPTVTAAPAAKSTSQTDAVVLASIALALAAVAVALGAAAFLTGRRRRAAK